MTSRLNDIVGEQGKIEGFLSNLPGYKGYKAKEMRRESDMILRDALARDLGAQHRRIAPMQEELLRGDGGIEMMGEFGALATALQTLIDRVKAAAKGYAGFFDAVRVKEDTLDRLEAFDGELRADVPKISSALDALGEAIEKSGDVKAALKAARKIAQDMSDTFAKRASVITGV